MTTGHIFDRRQSLGNAEERREALRLEANNLFCQAASQAILQDLGARGTQASDVVDLRAYWPQLADQTHIRSLDFVSATGALVGAGLLASQDVGHRYELILTEAGAKAIAALPESADAPDGRALRSKVTGR